MHYPIFPLNSPLLPGCSMPLQIFEQRYLDMVSSCMRKGSGFVVTLLVPGSEQQEVNRPQVPVEDGVPFYLLGTYAEIIDFGQRDNGLLLITIEGRQRQMLDRIEQQPDGLWIGQMTPIEDEDQLPSTPPPQWLDLLKQLLEMSGLKTITSDPDQLSSEQVMNYLIMLLPLPSPAKQSLISTNNLNQRWQNLLEFMEGLAREY